MSAMMKSGVRLTAEGDCKGLCSQVLQGIANSNALKQQTQVAQLYKQLALTYKMLLLGHVSCSLANIHQADALAVVSVCLLLDLCFLA